MNNLTILLFGRPQFFVNEREVTRFNTRKDCALLAYLAATGTAHSREHLSGLLWSDLPESKARRNLRHTLSHLQKAIGSTWVDTEQGIALTRQQPWSVDVQTLRSALGSWGARANGHGAHAEKDIDALAQTLNLYRGEFLQGFHIRGAASFEEWVLAQREEHQLLALQGLEHLGEFCLAQGEYAKGLAATQRLLQLEPWSETAHRLQMKLLVHSGRRAAALAQYKTCRQKLAEELGAEPMPQTVALYERILAGDCGPDVAYEPPADAVASSNHKQREADRILERVQPGQPIIPHNLPAALVKIIGYRDEMAYIRNRLANPDCRMLTLIGMGGAGKTHLALSAARQLVTDPNGSSRFSDGVYFVPLDGVREKPAADEAETAITLAIANALGCGLSGTGTPQAQLLTYLRSKRLLLLLDNLEHLVTGTSVLTALLQNAEGLFILSTSRSKLGLRGEYLLEVPGLVLAPTDAHHPPADDDAVTLFVERAQSINRHFRLSEENVSDIRRICELVDGLPLGIELATRWIEVFDCGTIADKIAQSLDFLVATQRDSTPRHHTLRAVFNTSWTLLPPRQRTLLARLSLFQPQFQLAAASAVAEASGRGLMDLVGQSLLTRNGDGSFTMHRNIRQFAREKLQQQAAERQALERSYASYYLDLLTQQTAEIYRPEWQDAKTELVQDMDNVHAALDLAIQNDQWPELRAALATTLALYEQQGWWADGVAFFQSAADRLAHQLSSDAIADPYALRVCLGQFLSLQGWSEARLGRVEAAHTTLQRSIVILRAVLAELEQGDRADAAPASDLLQPDVLQPDVLQPDVLQDVKQELGSSLRNFAMVYLFMGQPVSAIELLEEALPLLQRPENVAIALALLSGAWYRLGEYPRAKVYAQEGVQRMREQQNEWILGVLLVETGRIEQAQGNYRAAATSIQEAHRLQAQLRNASGLTQTFHDMGAIMRLQGKHDLAHAYLQRGLALAEEHGIQVFRQHLLWDQGNLALDQGNYGAAKAYFLESLQGQALHSITLGLPTLGWAYMGLGELEAAEAYFQAIIHTAQPRNAYRHWAEALSGLIVLLSIAGQLAEPDAWVAVIEQHPATTQETKDRLHTMYRRLVEAAPAAASRYHPAPELRQTVDDLLHMFAQSVQRAR